MSARARTQRLAAEIPRSLRRRHRSLMINCLRLRAGENLLEARIVAQRIPLPSWAKFDQRDAAVRTLPCLQEHGRGPQQNLIAGGRRSSPRGGRERFPAEISARADRTCQARRFAQLSPVAATWRAWRSSHEKKPHRGFGTAVRIVDRLPLVIVSGRSYSGSTAVFLD